MKTMGNVLPCLEASMHSFFDIIFGYLTHTHIFNDVIPANDHLSNSR